MRDSKDFKIEGNFSPKEKSLKTELDALLEMVKKNILKN